MKKIYIISSFILFLLLTVGCNKKVCSAYSNYPSKSQYKKTYKKSLKSLYKSSMNKKAKVYKMM